MPCALDTADRNMLLLEQLQHVDSSTQHTTSLAGSYTPAYIVRVLIKQPTRIRANARGPLKTQHTQSCGTDLGRKIHPAVPASQVATKVPALETAVSSLLLLFSHTASHTTALQTSLERHPDYHSVEKPPT
jgi:hypothetical protein